MRGAYGDALLVNHVQLEDDKSTRVCLRELVKCAGLSRIAGGGVDDGSGIADELGNGCGKKESAGLALDILGRREHSHTARPSQNLCRGSLRQSRWKKTCRGRVRGKCCGAKEVKEVVERGRERKRLGSCIQTKTNPRNNSPKRAVARCPRSPNYAMGCSGRARRREGLDDSSALALWESETSDNSPTTTA